MAAARSRPVVLANLERVDHDVGESSAIFWRFRRIARDGGGFLRCGPKEVLHEFTGSAASAMLRFFGE